MRNSHFRFLLFVAIGCWPIAVPLWAEVAIVDVQPGRLRIAYRAEGSGPHMGRSCLVGIPPEGAVEVEIVEAQISHRLDRAMVDKKLEGLRLDVSGAASHWEMLGEGGCICVCV